MRELKFRAWHPQLEEMHGNHTATHILSNRNAVFPHPHNHLYEIMQYTGMKDKNGKEIYEGDLIQFSKSNESSTEIFKVYWCCGSYVREEVTTGHIDECFVTWSSTVIGNIYQNPELLPNVP